MLGLVTPYISAVKYGLIAVAALALFGAGFEVRGWKDDAAQLAAVKAAVTKQAAEDKFAYDAAAAAAKHVEDVRYVTQVRTKEVTRWRDAPAARAVCLDDVGLRIANGALAGKAADRPEPDAGVPAAQR